MRALCNTSNKVLVDVMWKLTDGKYLFDEKTYLADNIVRIRLKLVEYWHKRKTGQHVFHINTLQALLARLSWALRQNPRVSFADCGF